MRVSQAYFDVLASAGQPGAGARAEDRGGRAAGIGQAQLRGRHLDHHRHARSPGALRPRDRAGDRGRERPAGQEDRARPAGRPPRQRAGAAGRAGGAARRRCRPTSNAWVAQAEDVHPVDPAGAARPRRGRARSRQGRGRPQAHARRPAGLQRHQQPAGHQHHHRPLAHQRRDHRRGVQPAAVRGLRDREPRQGNAGTRRAVALDARIDAPQRDAGHARGLPGPGVGRRAR